MAILLEEEVDIKKIRQRFDKKGGKYHEVELGYPDINEKWTFKNEIKIHTQDLDTIIQSVQEDYKEINYDLIIITFSNIMARSIRTANVYTDLYKLK